MYNWLKQNKLTLNTDKTKYIAFTTTNMHRLAFTSITDADNELTTSETFTVECHLPLQLLLKQYIFYLLW